MRWFVSHTLTTRHSVLGWIHQLSVLALVSSTHPLGSKEINEEIREASPDDKGYTVLLVSDADSYRDVATKRVGFSPAERNRRINNIKRNSYVVSIS